MDKESKKTEELLVGIKQDFEENDTKTTGKQAKEIDIRLKKFNITPIQTDL